MAEYVVRPVGRVESPLRRREDAPKQHGEGAPDAVVVLDPEFAQAASDIRPGDRVVLVTWLHLSDRDVLRVHPRGDEDRPLTGVFSTRSPARPNPVGLHEVEVVGVEPRRLLVRGLEAVDGTPVVDIKPAR
jgi:tRNA-Thr(GGU) m(6)t(6)A37 methyltransferase TsaA